MLLFILVTGCTYYQSFVCTCTVSSSDTGHWVDTGATFQTCSATLDRSDDDAEAQCEAHNGSGSCGDCRCVGDSVGC